MPEEKTKAEKFIEKAKKLFKQCEEREHDIRVRCADDLVFLSSTPDEPEGQWGLAALASRIRRGRPALVVNRMDQFVLHVSNAQRQNRVSAKVFPVDDKADVDTAEVRQGLLRHIEYSSTAHLAYDTAAFYAVAMGFGYWRLDREYCNPTTFEQDIKINRISNPFSVYLGPHDKPDGSDAEFAFIFTDMTEEEYKAQYPDSEMASLRDWRGIGEGDSDPWVDEKGCRVAEFYYTEWKDDTLVRLKNGVPMLKSELSDEEYERLADRNENGEVIERDTRIPTVKWCKFNATEILEEADWPTPQIPIVKVTGQELDVNGKTILKGIVRNLKDAQRQYNLMLSAQAEAVNSSKGHVVMVEGQEEGHEAEWRDPDQQKVLRVKATDVNGQLAPLPTRLPPNMSIPAMNEARLMAAEDLKALAGIYDAALGARSNETSGRGIMARQAQSDTANFHYQDNLTTSITHSTRMIINLQEKVYDTPRVVRIIGEDDAAKIVKINQDFQENGKQKRYDFSVGKYDVVCTAGPSSYTKQQEDADRLSLVLQGPAGKIVMTAAPDMVLKAFGFPDIGERLAKAVPPEMQDSSEQPQVPPQVLQQLKMQGQMIEMQTEQIKEMTSTIKNKTLELEAKMNIERKKLEVEMEKVHSEAALRLQELESNEAIAALKADVELLKQRVQADMAQMAQEANAAAANMGANAP